MRYNVSWHDSWILWAVIAAAILLLLAPRSAHGQPVIFSVHTHRNSDTLYVGERAHISFSVDAQGAVVQGMVFPLRVTFGAGSLIGSMPEDASLEVNPLLISPFHVELSVDSLNGSDPDTFLVGLVSFSAPFATGGSDWAMRWHFQPLDQGQIVIDSITLPPANQLAALNPLGENLPIEWHSSPLAVLPCPNVLGDVNQSGQVTSADIILFVNCVFLCDPGPHDIWELGDVNCSGTATSSDAIAMVNYVFKSTPLPFCCNVLD